MGVAGGPTQAQIIRSEAMTDFQARRLQRRLDDFEVLLLSLREVPQLIEIADKPNRHTGFIIRSRSKLKSHPVPSSSSAGRAE